MIQVHTRFVGVLDCPEQSVIRFPSGIPPFTDQSFILISKEDSPFFFLQSVTTPDLCFITLPLQAVDPDYRLVMEPHDAETLGFGNGEHAPDVLTRLTILTIPEQGTMTANLAAPVLINPAVNIGVQAVRSDGAYSHTHPLDGGSGG